MVVAIVHGISIDLPAMFLDQGANYVQLGLDVTDFFPEGAQLPIKKILQLLHLGRVEFSHVPALFLQGENKNK